LRTLEEILGHIDILRTAGDSGISVRQLAFDSRKVEPGDIFIAQKGTQVDGHQFIDIAVKKGAKAVVCQDWPAQRSPDVVYLQVANTQEALGEMAATYYGHPSRELQLVAVTGTNGKTTTVTLLHDLFTAMGYKTGLLSTIENRIGQVKVPATHTTPDALQLQSLLAEMVEAGCDYAFMEASSHAIDQRRMAGLQLAGAVFTNISHDHLDYHKTFKAYIFAKKRLFDHLPAEAFALVNADDKRAEVMLQNCKAKAYSFAVRTKADFQARIIENSLMGLHLDLDGKDFYGKLIGDFNAYNLLTVYGVARLLEQDALEVLTALSGLDAADGRFQTVQDDVRGVTGIVDYAHTPDALEKVLNTLHQFSKQDRALITVVGCGGDRDKAKRPIMAKVAADYSDRVILTSDNPRSENPQQILKEMEDGVPEYAERKVLTITDRKEAIKTATMLAQPGDVILIAGKGHEKYQEINGVKHPFDDLEILKQYL
jgi:UDP-N-acetylmuramoyl-L-alanyl-D-glutamate--2,6-diaminopimelate ligase